jgi:hypothetical protein
MFTVFDSCHIRRRAKTIIEFAAQLLFIARSNKNPKRLFVIRARAGLIHL